MTSTQAMKLDELKEMALDADRVDQMDHAEVVRLLQSLKLGLPDLPSLRRHTIASIPDLNEALSRETLNDILSIANRLGEPVKR